ncbi:MAG: ComF family protein [Myxococcales bacterium]|nr:ComF family protein [Myxococcales bacterium]
MLDVIFPPSCVACGAVLPAPGHFCEACQPEVERLPRRCCPRCSEPGEFQGGCPRCLARPPAFCRAFAPFTHQGAVARAIHRFKYEDHPELARPLAELLAGFAADFLEGAPRLVAAIPLHERRFRARKYDQAMLLAVELSKRVDGGAARELLVRTKDTGRQVGLSDQAREANVAGAFAAVGSAAGLSVLLLDDVLTTGATARAAASALLDAGAREVQVLTLARADLLSL